MSWSLWKPSGKILAFTTDPAVRVGIMQAAWSVAPAYSRGLLPRSSKQQAVVVSVSASTQYAIGATGWSAISSVYAGLPGRRAGWKALLAGSAVTGVAGYVGERLLRPKSGSSLVGGAAWSVSRYAGTIGLAGGIVTTTDLAAHKLLGRDPNIWTTLALDVAGGAAMAAGSMARRKLRLKKYGMVDPEREAVAAPKSPKAYAQIVGISAGTIVGIAGFAVVEQTATRAITASASRLSGTDLGETGTLLAHGMTASVIATGAAYGLSWVRRRTQRENDVTEPAYPTAPDSPHVSCGPQSEVPFEDIGKEGRRFVLMTLTARQIEKVMQEEAKDPVRIVVPRQGPIPDRVALAISELEALGGFERELIVIASPTGVGYVNYVMAEALEYLARGNCAIVVPQYALVPSALALDTTDQGTQLQAEILQAVSDHIQRMSPGNRPRVVQFGESLGAQVALDVAAQGGVHRLNTMNVAGGLYLGVPFRSRTWRVWRKNPRAIDPDGQIVQVINADHAPTKPGTHLMVIHDDDPVNKFSYTSFVQRPWWMGPPEERPPMVPREALFRPVISFVISLVDVLNGMNSKPGEFKRIGHDYRIDLRASLEKAYLLRSSPEQAAHIESELREREQLWAQTRLVAKTAANAMATIQQTLRDWGQESMTTEVADQEGVNLPPSVRKMLKSMNEMQFPQRFGSSGGP